jgi:hypothetical protein
MAIFMRAGLPLVREQIMHHARIRGTGKGGKMSGLAKSINMSQTSLLAGEVAMVRFGLLTGFIIALAAAPATADPELRGATLPNARTVPLNSTATAFFTVLNSGSSDATNCSLATSAAIGSPDLDDFVFESQIVENGAGTGPLNPSITIPANGRVDLVVGVARNPASSFNNSVYAFLRVDCDAGFSSPAWPEVNGLQVQFRANAPDIIMIADTVSRDGIANFNGNRTALVAVAAVNIGAGNTSAGDVDGIQANEADLVLRAATSENASPVSNVRACALDDAGACTAGFSTCTADRRDDCLSTSIGDSPELFALHFDISDAYGSAFAPNVRRLTPVLASPSTSTEASTSVAQGPAITNPVIDPTTPMSGRFEAQVRNTNDATGQSINTGFASFRSDGTGMLEVIRSIDRGFFIQLVPQYANFTHETFPDGTRITQIAFQDTRAGDESRPNDHYVVETGRLSCAITPATGGRCSATDGPGEQIAAEPELFDAGEPFTLELSPDATIARDAAFARTHANYRNLVFHSLTVGGQTSAALVRTDEPKATDTSSSKVFILNIDGCEVRIAVGQSLSGQVIDTFFIPTTTMVADVYIPADNERCDTSSALGMIAAGSGHRIGDEFILQSAAISTAATLDGTRVSYRFSLSADPTDPNSVSRSFELVLAEPSGG